MKKHSVLLPVLFASAGLMLLTGCKDSPAKVTKKYISATRDGNEAAALALVSGKNMKAAARKAAASGRQGKAIKSAKFSNPIIEDDEATVDMTYEVTTKVRLKKVEGKWKVVGVDL